MRNLKMLIAVLAVGLGSFMATPPADAATGYVYLVVPKWWGWCPGSSNYATWVGYVNSNVSSGGDSGDDIVYARVNLNQPNTITMAVHCRRTLPQGSQATIRPTRNNQTFWMGYPSGAYGN